MSAWAQSPRQMSGPRPPPDAHSCPESPFCVAFVTWTQPDPNTTSSAAGPPIRGPARLTGSGPLPSFYPAGRTHRVRDGTAQYHPMYETAAWLERTSCRLPDTLHFHDLTMPCIALGGSHETNAMPRWRGRPWPRLLFPPQNPSTRPLDSSKEVTSNYELIMISPLTANQAPDKQTTGWRRLPVGAPGMCMPQS